MALIYVVIQLSPPSSRAVWVPQGAALCPGIIPTHSTYGPRQMLVHSYLMCPHIFLCFPESSLKWNRTLCSVLSSSVPLHNGFESSTHYHRYLLSGTHDVDIPHHIHLPTDELLSCSIVSKLSKERILAHSFGGYLSSVFTSDIPLGQIQVL